MGTWSVEASSGRPTKGEKEQRFFPPLLEKRHFYWTDFFETSIRATTQSIQVVKKNSVLCNVTIR